MTSAPIAADFPLQAMRPAQACAPQWAALVAGASLGLLLAQGLLAGLVPLPPLENPGFLPHLLERMAVALPRPGDAAAHTFSLALCLLGALIGGLCSALAKPAISPVVPAANEALRSWVRAGDLVELQFPSGSWVLVRAQVNDRQWRDVQRLLVWSRRMARGDAH